MLRTLILIRHAKSSWADPGQEDFDRPLNERGRKDAPFMGAILKENHLCPDLMVSSTAKRAAETTRRMAKAMEYPEENIHFKDLLYHCPAETFKDVVDTFPDTAPIVSVTAHNPGITDYLNTLNSLFYTDNMPTCCIAGIRAEAGSWLAFRNAPKEIFLFHYPRQFHDRP